MRISKNYLGIGFEVWNSQQTWFWLVDNTNRNAMIGAASTESEAMHEARSSIEEISNSPMRPDWESALGKLMCYIASVAGATA